MPTVVVANPKGGVGKSTLATNIAGLFARQGHAVMLGDLDRQHSSRQWLGLRPAHLPPIRSWDVDRDEVVRPPKGTTHVVIDTPAGLHGRKLDRVLAVTDRLLVPLQPSLFDIQATHGFLREVQDSRHAGRVRIGLVAMRLREHTSASDRLHDYLGSLKLPVVAWLRDTHNYVHLAAHGLTLWDVAPSRVEKDLEQWLSLRSWLSS